GPEAMLHPVATTLWGTVLHLIVSVAFGLLFASLVRRETRPLGAILGALAYSAGLFLLMTFIVVPLTNSVLAARAPMMLGTIAAMHVLFALGLSLAPAFRRRAALRSR